MSDYPEQDTLPPGPSADRLMGLIENALNANDIEFMAVAGDTIVTGTHRIVVEPDTERVVITPREEADDDTQSSASRQHYIDTGHYLKRGES